LVDLSNLELAAIPWGDDEDEEAPHASEETAPASSAHAPDLTVHQYASYCAELSLYGGAHATAIGARYGIVSRDMHDQIVAAWHDRLRAAPHELATWQRGFDAYRQWLIERHHH